MKIIFVGTSEFGIPALEMLHKSHEILAVITQPDKPAGKKKIITPPPVKSWALEHGLEILQPEKIAEVADKIQGLAPDAMIVASYGQIIPKSILNLPKKGSINLHSSLLPKYRGASPIQAALLNDDKETGVSIMLMDEQLDHGAILAQKKVTISDNDDYTSLHEKLADAAAECLQDTLPKWMDGTIQPQPQDDSQASVVKLIRREHARIDWTKPARQIFKKIKALNPEPGTWTTLHNKSVKIIEAQEVRTGKIDLPGTIYAEGRDCLVKCGDYSLKLLLVQMEGKKPITGPDFLNGVKNSETKIFT